MDTRVKPAYDVSMRALPHTNWSIRVPCPGGSAASTVGCGRRVPSAAPVAFALLSGAVSGGLGAMACSGAIGAEVLMLAIDIGNIPFVASDLGRVQANDL
jgi:hypothetical protein